MKKLFGEEILKYFTLFDCLGTGTHSTGTLGFLKYKVFIQNKPLNELTSYPALATDNHISTIKSDIAVSLSFERVSIAMLRM